MESFLKFYNDSYEKIDLRDKSDSRLMRTINRILLLGNKIGICSIDNFLGDYVTTIGNTIYSSPCWSYSRNVDTTMVHELTHVNLWSFNYALSYAFSQKARYHYEAICVQAEMICFPDIVIADQNFVSRKVKALGGYGNDVDYLRKQLIRRMDEILDIYGRLRIERAHPAALLTEQAYSKWKMATSTARRKGE